MTMGTQAGLLRTRQLVAVVPLTLAFSALTTLVVDLDRPQQGLVQVGQQSMAELLEMMDRDLGSD